MGKSNMRRSDVTELHFIAPIANVPSILEHGILSNHLSSRLPHISVAMQVVQERRQNKQIPNARILHDYANLYFDAHNPMLSKLRDWNNEICILQVNHQVLDLSGVIISDRNASSRHVRFYTVEAGLEAIDKDKLFTQYWTHPENLFDEWAHKSIKCAEILVPEKVDPKYITGAYVANDQALLFFQQLNIRLTVCIKSGIFF